MAPRIIVIGPMGAGKSTVASAISQRLALPHRDTDEIVVGESGRSISEIFLEDGEDAFRALEKIALRVALLEDETILSLGGGACMNKDAESALRASGAFIVYLKISLSEVSSRVGFNRDRPLLLGSPRAQWQTLMNERAPIYESLSSYTVDVDGKSAETIVDEILIAYELRG
jgi:shikimate kinase